MRRLMIAAAVVFSLFGGGEGRAQNSRVVQTCGTLPLAYLPGATRNDTVDINGNKCIAGSISASFASFHLESVLTPLTAGMISGASSSFIAGKTIVATNNGATNTAYCQPGATATLSSQPITPGNWFAFATSTETTIACITSTSTTPVNFSVGTGGPAGTGGGVGGGSSGGAVTLASGAVASGAFASGSIGSGAMVDLGSQADSVCATATGTCSSIALQKYLNTAAGNPLPVIAGTAPSTQTPVATGATTKAQTDLNGNLYLSPQQAGGILATSLDPCSNFQAKLTADFESTSSGGSIITAVSAKKAYICSVAIVASVAANVSLIEGTGSSVCTGGTPAGVYLNTGVTAANGAAFSANSGIAQSGGGMTLAQNATANQNVCVLFTTSGTPQVNVHISYVQQ